MDSQTPMTDALDASAADVDAELRRNKDAHWVLNWMQSLIDRGQHAPIETMKAYIGERQKQSRELAAVTAERDRLREAALPILDLLDNRTGDMYDADGGPTDELNIAVRRLRAALVQS